LLQFTVKERLAKNGAGENQSDPMVATEMRRVSANKGTSYVFQEIKGNKYGIRRIPEFRIVVSL